MILLLFGCRNMQLHNVVSKSCKGKTEHHPSLRYPMPADTAFIPTTEYMSRKGKRALATFGATGSAQGEDQILE